MGIFRQLLAKRQPDPSGRRWLFVPYDRLSDSIGPLSREDPVNLGIILVENTWKAARQPYHKQKQRNSYLARSFAVETRKEDERYHSVRIIGSLPLSEQIHEANALI